MLGLFTSSSSIGKLLLIIGLILLVSSLFTKKTSKKIKEKVKKSYSKIKIKLKCHNCGAEIDEDDNFCPECGKKILP